MEIRPYRSGDEKAIWTLDRKLESHPWNRRELSNWYWKFTDNNPSGRSFIWLMEKDGSIIAHFAAVPFKLKVFSQELIASHSIGALVEEEYQNRGVLKFVGDKLFEELRQNNIPFTYGFPNKRAYNLHKAFMGYSDLVFFDTWKAKNLHTANGSSPLSFQEITEFSDDFDILWRNCCGEYGIAVARDKNYLNWRYLKRPDWRYFPFGIYQGNNLRGYAVLKLYKEETLLRGHILDVFTRFDDKEALSKIIDGSLHFFRKQNVGEVTCWIWGHPLFEKLLMEKGFLREITRIPLLIRINKEFEHEEEVKDSRNWYFTMGDSTEIF